MFFIWTGRQGVYTDRHDDRYGGRVPLNNNKMNNKNCFLIINPVFGWQPVKCLEQWSKMLVSAPAKNNLRCMVLNFLQPVHLITVDVNEQRVAVVQPENERTHKLSSGFRRQQCVYRNGIELILLISRHAEWLMWSTCFAIDRVASM